MREAESVADTSQTAVGPNRHRWLLAPSSEAVRHRDLAHAYTDHHRVHPERLPVVLSGPTGWSDESTADWPETAAIKA